MASPRERLEIALQQPEPASAAYELARALRDEGMTQLAMHQMFDAFRAGHERDADETIYNAILDSMDCICGWSAASHRLYDTDLMQTLPKGVTGFDVTESNVPAKRFAAACHSAARQVGARVHHVRDAAERVTPNFHEAVVTWMDGVEDVRVLCNAHHPIVAFATPVDHEGDVRIEFVDCPQLARPLSAEFRVLSKDGAAAGIPSNAVIRLGESELDQMRYWNPQRIGDLIFNFWD
jgi:hypothetical protein